MYTKKEKISSKGAIWQLIVYVILSSQELQICFSLAMKLPFPLRGFRMGPWCFSTAYMVLSQNKETPIWTPKYSNNPYYWDTPNLGSPQIIHNWGWYMGLTPCLEPHDLLVELHFRSRYSHALTPQHGKVLYGQQLLSIAGNQMLEKDPKPETSSKPI